jgi:hypothetical protein
MGWNPREWAKNSVFIVPFTFVCLLNFAAFVVILGGAQLFGSDGGRGPSPCDDAVMVTSARQHLGERISVVGRVISVQAAEHDTGAPTFLNIDADYPDPDRFSVVIWGQNADEFDDLHDYDDEIVCVRGTLKDYQGVVQAELADSDDIEVWYDEGP